MSVENNAKTTPKKQGGVTGKGFVAGQSGNPGGRPRTKPLTARYAAVLETELPDDIRRSKRLPRGTTFGDAIALMLARAALKGDRGALAELMDRVEGKIDGDQGGGGMVVVNTSVMRDPE
jgi:Family of unknown function (DUF5681)